MSVPPPLLHQRPWLSPDDTYALRGLCMIMIVVSHVVDTSGTTFYQFWGGWGTGVFLFLSGYGLFFSLNRQPADWSYLRRKLAKLLEPYFFMWSVYIILFALFDRQQFTWHLLQEFLTLSMPGLAAWFFKVIIGLYILDWLVFRLNISNTARLILVTLTCAAWYIVARQCGMGPWWFNTILCFPCGMAVALWYPYLNRNFWIFPLTILLLTCVWSAVSWGSLPYLWFTAIAITVIRYLDITSPVMHFIGNQSLFFYFLEVPVLYLLVRTCPYSTPLYAILAVLLCGLLTWGYLSVKRRVIQRQ